MFRPFRIGVAVSFPLFIAASAVGRRQAAEPNAGAPALRFGDFDNDGLLDLYAVRPQASDRLYKNLGDGTFGDVGDSVGLGGVTGSRLALWLDFDGDGWLDLYIGAAMGASRLLRNDGGRAFVDVTLDLGLAPGRGSELAAESFDFDLDGWTDLCVVTATGEILYRNVEGERFEPVDLGLGDLAFGPAVIELAPPHAPHAVVPDEPAERDPAPRPGAPGSYGPRTPSGGMRTIAAAPFAPAGAPSAPAAVGAATPTLICAGSLADQSSGACLQASSTPTLGDLYPLSTVLNVSANGRVGIGTTSPAAGLHVAHYMGLLATGQYSTGSVPAQGAGVRMMWYPGKAAFRVGHVTGSEWDEANVGLDSFASGYITKASGAYSTAMGFAAVASGAKSAAIGTNVNATGACTTAMGLATDAVSYCGVTLGRYNVGGGDPVNWIATDPLLEIGNGSGNLSRNNAVTVLKSGNVGIGTSAPSNPLHVRRAGTDAGGVPGSAEITAHFLQSTSATHSAVSVDALSGQDSILYLAEDGSAVWGLRNDSSAGDGFNLRYHGGGANTTMVTVQPTGSVGIGTTAPAFLLHVNGSAGKPGGGSWSVASDARLKTDVEELDGALTKLLALRGVTFRYVDPDAIGELDGERTGFIAQEVERVFPDWVEEGADGYERLTIRGFEALAVEALRDLQAEKDAEIAALRSEKDAQLAAVEAELAELRALVGASLAAAERRTRTGDR